MYRRMHRINPTTPTLGELSQSSINIDPRFPVTRDMNYFDVNFPRFSESVDKQEAFSGNEPTRGADLCNMFIN